MKVDIRYVVTYPSEDGTFEKDDHIRLNKDGTIACIEAQGWVDAEDAEEACKGMKCVVDTEWEARRREFLNNELERLDKQYFDKKALS